MKQDTMGAFICELRKEKGLTQKQLAQQMNVTDKAISKWERGLGYPDITMLLQLAQVLGVSVSELLEGTRGEAPAPKTETLVQTTLRYSEKASQERSRRARNLVFFIITTALAVGIFVCVLCDFLLSGRLTWSVYVLGSAVFAWLVLAPLFWLPRHRVAGTLLSCSVFVIPLLFLIERTSGGDWFWPIATPIAAVSLSYVWIGFWLFTRKGFNRWYATSIVCFLAGPHTVFTNAVAAAYEGAPLFRPWDIFSVLSACIFAVVFLVLGRTVGRTKQ